MLRHKFLRNIGLGTTASLLTNYDVPTKINDDVKINIVKHQYDFSLMKNLVFHHHQR
ncbi:hypothetical protein I4U23_011482 [Adineta vaga]|nr:hypothetical protein I4U23_011482 [Adineta vaga]